MIQIKRIWKKAVPFLIAVSLLSGSSPVYAGGPPYTRNVWLDVAGGVQDDLQARLSVTLPMMYGFVVNGSTTDSRTGISVDAGTLLLPNFTVEVTDHSRPDGPYRLKVHSQAGFTFKNYSTIIDQDDSTNQGRDPGIRAGLKVSLDAYIENAGGAVDRGYWEAVPGMPSEAAEDFKKYRVSFINKEDEAAEHIFSEPGPGVLAGRIYLKEKIPLDPPDGGYGFQGNGLAKVPSTLETGIGVEVGGYQGQYRQVEESVKAGTIYWEIHW